MRDALNNILQRSYSVVSSSDHPGICKKDSLKVSPEIHIADAAVKCCSSSSSSPLLTLTCCGRLCSRRNIKSIVALAFLGMSLLAAGISVLQIQPYDLLFKWKVAFTDGGEIFEMWRTPPVDLYLRVYLFNVTNKDAFLRGEEKLKVEEVGPYVYKENLSHKNVTFNANGTLSTVPSHPLVWVPELSEGRLESDQLVLPHIALLSIAHVVSSESFFTRLGLNVLIDQTDSQPLVQMSAREFMFGYESALMSLGYNFLPNWINFDKLGLIDRMYNFDGDFETVYTGESDISKVGLIDTYRGSPDLPQWPGQCANVRDASDGTKFKSFISEGEDLLFFRRSMCRAQTLVQVNKTAVSGLEAYRYEFLANETDNGKYRPENECFCRQGRCLTAGFLDVTECYYGFPIATSYPHFLDADPEALENVEGLHPDPAKHRTFFTVQSKSGLPLEVAARFQINMALGDLSSINNVNRFSNMYLPMLWTEIRMFSLPDSLAMRFNIYINVGPIAQEVAQYVCLVLGAALVALAAHRAYQRVGAHRGAASSSRWLVEEGLHSPSKLSSVHMVPYMPERRSSLSSRELETYISSLTTPLNQSICEQDDEDLAENA